jgi:transposase
MLKPAAIRKIPAETARIAKAAFPKRSTAMKLRDSFGSFYQDEDFRHLFSHTGQPALAPWRLAFVTLLQFMENLTDRQAADAVRGRVDWKYALGLKLEDPGFDRSVLSEFRSRLVAGNAEHLLLDKMLERFKEEGLLKERGHQRTDSTHVLSAVRRLQRLELVGETLRATLNELSRMDAAWVKEHVPSAWFERYGRRIEEYRLPKAKAAREAYAMTVADDGYALLEMLSPLDIPSLLRDAPMVEVLRQVWEQEFIREGKRIRWRRANELQPSGERIHSPYDPDACYATRRDVAWTGYKVHVTETCGEEELLLVTHVHTTPAVIQDVSSTAGIHTALAERKLLPQEHIVDGGYTDADLLVTSQSEHGVRLIGPMRMNRSWQARSGGYDRRLFQVDWEAQKVTCPQGELSVGWRPETNQFGTAEIHVRFSPKNCQVCPTKALCTKSKHGRKLLLQPREQYDALQQAREFAGTEEYAALYRERAGVEGTLSQASRGLGLRRTRYRGLGKTALRNVAVGAAVNATRVAAWIGGQARITQPVTRFMKLAA